MGEKKSNTRKKLIEAFSNHPNEFLSGQQLAEKIGVSRTAIWKYIKELRAEGYELEALPKKGYKIVDKPDGLTDSEIVLGLRTTTFGRHVIYHESVDTTQKIAHAAIQEDCPHGTLVVTDEQKQGRGRMEREWQSNKGKGILMSLILRPPILPQQAPLFTLLTSVAIVDALRDYTDVPAEIKWPNDIFIQGKKVAGILTEMQGDIDRIKAIILGIGINVHQHKEDFLENIQEKATSVTLHTEAEISRAALVQEILLRMETYYQLFIDSGFDDIKQAWLQYTETIGKTVTVNSGLQTLTGKAIGLNNQGALQLLTDDGTIHHVMSGYIE